MKLTYKTCCVSSNCEDIMEMVDNSKEITYKTFIKYVDSKEILNMFCSGSGWKSLSQDRCVRYFKSKFQGKPCYYLDHSAIEHIWS